MTSHPRYMYLSVDIFDHPKILPLKRRRKWGAIALYIQGLAYSTRYLTDGFVPMEWADGFARADRQALLDNELWYEVRDDPGPGQDPDPGRCGYMINDFLAYQISRAEWTEQGKKRRERAQKAARTRWQSRHLKAVSED
jgi:hypothetical protein